MTKVQVIRQSSYRRATWKNGLGYTDEIAIFPEGSDLRRGDFLWRLSSARIDQASPFSVFPEHDRNLVILKGDGIRLFHRFDEESSEEMSKLLPFVPYEFPGDIQSRCELISRSVQDLSVFIRKGEAEALVTVIEIEADRPYLWRPNGRSNFAFVAAGKISDPSGLAPDLEPGDTLRLDLTVIGDAPTLIQATPTPTQVILIEIRS